MFWSLSPGHHHLETVTYGLKSILSYSSYGSLIVLKATAGVSLIVGNAVVEVVKVAVKSVKKNPVTEYNNFEKNISKWIEIIRDWVYVSTNVPVPVSADLSHIHSYAPAEFDKMSISGYIDADRKTENHAYLDERIKVLIPFPRLVRFIQSKLAKKNEVRTEKYLASSSTFSPIDRMESINPFDEKDPVKRTEILCTHQIKLSRTFDEMIAEREQEASEKYTNRTMVPPPENIYSIPTTSSTTHTFSPIFKLDGRNAKINNVTGAIVYVNENEITITKPPPPPVFPKVDGRDVVVDASGMNIYLDGKPSLMYQRMEAQGDFKRPTSSNGLLLPFKSNGGDGGGGDGGGIRKRNPSLSTLDRVVMDLQSA
jgi:hypothetical protein